MLPRLLNIPATLAVSVLMGVVLGLSLNLLNARVSPEYFNLVLRSPAPPMRIALFHGVVEGGLLGLGVGVLLTIVLSIGGWRHFVFKHTIAPLTACYITATVCIAIGGMIGWALGWSDRGMYVQLFPVARFATDTAAFGWVGGSIWGAYAGAVLGLVMAARWFYRRAKRLDESTQGFDVVEAI